MLRGNRSFAQRNRLATLAQRELWDSIYPKYEMAIEAFGEKQPILEIGFGNGENLYHLATTYPQYFWVGIEVYQPGFHHLLRLLQEKPLGNLRLIKADAMIVLARLPSACLRGCLILYPDPWPKLKHHKRRLVNNNFLQILTEKMQLNGAILFKTDYFNYAQQVKELLLSSTSFRLIEPPWQTIPTKYEKKALAQGQLIFSFAYKKVCNLL